MRQRHPVRTYPMTVGEGAEQYRRKHEIQSQYRNASALFKKKLENDGPLMGTQSPGGPKPLGKAPSVQLNGIL